MNLQEIKQHISEKTREKYHLCQKLKLPAFCRGQTPKLDVSSLRTAFASLLGTLSHVFGLFSAATSVIPEILNSARLLDFLLEQNKYRPTNNVIVFFLKIINCSEGGN